MPKYYDNWEADDYACGECSWQGKGSELQQGDMTGEYFDLNCPKCGERRTSVFFPTLEQSRANWEKVSEADKLIVEMIEQRQKENEGKWLTDINQLPEISEASFTLIWECPPQDGPQCELLIKHGDEIIFKEPGVYEGLYRFEEIAKILKKKYGTAIQDLIPTESSFEMLYGDRSGGPSFVKNVRRRIFEGYNESELYLQRKWEELENELIAEKKAKGLPPPKFGRWSANAA